MVDDDPGQADGGGGEGLTEPIIELESLEKRFGDVRALVGASLALAPGATGLLGPNGAGKSTLITLLLGLIPPDRGQGRVLGHDIRRDGMAIRRQVGYLPEDDCTFPDQTGMEMVVFAGELCGMSRRQALSRAHDVLGYVGLSEARYRPVAQFSTGMKQRIKLATALVHDPPLLLLDEPATGLDPAGRAQMLDLIADLAGPHGKSLLLSTHLLPDVERVCGHVVVMAAGKVVADGALGELLADDRGNAFQLKARETAAELAAALSAAGLSAEARPDGTVLALLEPEVSPARLFEAAATGGVQIRELEPARRTLEDVFLEKVGG